MARDDPDPSMVIATALKEVQKIDCPWCKGTGKFPAVFGGQWWRLVGEVRRRFVEQTRLEKWEEWKAKNYPYFRMRRQLLRALVDQKGIRCERCSKPLLPTIKGRKVSRFHPERATIHHKDRDRKNNDLSNLELLCGACHLTVHGKTYRKKKEVGIDG